MRRFLYRLFFFDMTASRLAVLGLLALALGLGFYVTGNVTLVLLWGLVGLIPTFSVWARWSRYRFLGRLALGITLLVLYATLGSGFVAVITSDAYVARSKVAQIRELIAKSTRDDGLDPRVVWVGSPGGTGRKSGPTPKDVKTLLPESWNCELYGWLESPTGYVIRVDYDRWWRYDPQNPRELRGFPGGLFSFPPEREIATKVALLRFSEPTPLDRLLEFCGYTRCEHVSRTAGPRKWLTTEGR